MSFPESGTAQRVLRTIVVVTHHQAEPKPFARPDLCSPGIGAGHLLAQFSSLEIEDRLVAHGLWAYW